MTRNRLVLGLSLLALITIPAFAGPSAATTAATQPTAPPQPVSAAPAALPANMTVGQFVVRFAQAIEPAPVAGLTPEQAVARLAVRGIVMPPGLSLSAPLTRDGATAIAAAAGVHSAVTDPRDNFGAAYLARLLSRMRANVTTRLLEEGGPEDDSVGPCCIDGACTLRTRGNCVNAGGIFRGIGGTCEDNPCESNKAQCCISRQDCRITTQDQCTAFGGVFTGRDSCFPSGNACRNPQPATPSEP